MQDSPTAAYACHSQFSDPGQHAVLLRDLPVDAPSICRVLQGLFIHLYELHLYGVEASAEDRANGDIEHAETVLTKILERSATPLTTMRPLNQRVGVICRQYAMLACSILREHRIPARMRGGHADYLATDRWVGHSVCECWDIRRGRWVRFDPQIDAIQRQAHHIDFDVLDLPQAHYLTGAAAWCAYREGRLAAEHVESGVAQLRNGVVLDLLEMCKLETHRHRPIIMLNPSQPPTAEELPHIDRISEGALAAEQSFPKLWAIYSSEPCLQIPAQPAP